MAETKKNIKTAQQQFANRSVKYRNVKSISTNIYVLVSKQDDLETVLECEEYTRHPVICKPKDARNADECEFEFIDDAGRSYVNWESYLRDNDLPKGIMVAPQNGIYTLDGNGNVLLHVCRTPTKSTADCRETLTLRNVQQDFAEMNEDLENEFQSTNIYVLVAQENDLDAVLGPNDFSCHSLICKKLDNGSSDDYLFIDESGRNYKNWSSYLKDNNLPEGIMIAPKNGVYSFDECRKVLLETCETPAKLAAANGESTRTLTVRDFQQDFAELSICMEDASQTTNINILVTKQSDLVAALESNDFSCHTVIRTKIADGFFRFVDDAGRTYENWDTYLNTNDLPEGIMIAPLNGVYSFDSNGLVDLEVCLTPNSLGPIDNTSDVRTVRSAQQTYANIDKYTKSNIIHVLVTKRMDISTALDDTEFSDFVVFRKKNSDGSVFFVDDVEYIYPTWKAYLNGNKLDEGLMIAPLDGTYTLDDNQQVCLHVGLTPAAAAKRKRTIREIQQDLAENCGHRKDVIWDLLNNEQGEVLKTKIRELIPDQKKGQKKIEEMRETIFNSVWAQRKYTNGNSLTSIIYILVTNCEDLLRVPEVTDKFSCHPVFRARRCIAESDSSKCCMVFIDELGRVYQNWAAYVQNNELPAGIMVAPLNGVYSFDDEGRVQLEMYSTPAGSTAAKVLTAADTTTAIAGFGAAAVPLAALAFPIAAPIVAGAAAVCVTTATYSFLRSACNLYDRKQHEQSISITNSQARNNYINMGASAVGVAASGATKAMTTAAAAGREVSLVTEIVVNGINISSIVLSGTGVANGVLDLILKYQDDDDISSMDVVQLAASLVLFTHSVTNFRLASTLINDAHHSTIQEYRKGLSKSQRRMFDKISKETMRIKGSTKGQIDIIRNVNEIPSKQYLNDLYKINKQLNEQKVRPAFGAKGEGVVLNNQLRVNTGELRSSVQHNIGPNILQQVTQPIPASHSESTNNFTGRGQLLQGSRIIFNNNNNISENSSASAGARAFGLGTILLPTGITVALSDFGTRLFDIIDNADSFDAVLTTMANIFSEESFRFLMRVAQDFVEHYMDQLCTVLKIFISAESILYRILVHCMKNYTNRTIEFLETQRQNIIEAIKNYFNSLNPNSYGDLLKKCDICIGRYAECDL